MLSSFKCDELYYQYSRDFAYIYREWSDGSNEQFAFTQIILFLESSYIYVFIGEATIFYVIHFMLLTKKSHIFNFDLSNRFMCKWWCLSFYKIIKTNRKKSTKFSDTICVKLPWIQFAFFFENCNIHKIYCIHFLPIISINFTQNMFTEKLNENWYSIWLKKACHIVKCYWLKFCM